MIVMRGITIPRRRALEQSERDRDQSVQLGEILSDRVGELEHELLLHRYPFCRSRSSSLLPLFPPPFPPFPPPSPSLALAVSPFLLLSPYPSRFPRLPPPIECYSVW
jgi:hypothetical protein